MFSKRKVDQIRNATEAFISTEGHGSVNVVIEAAGCTRQNFFKFRKDSGLGDPFLKKLQSFLQEQGYMTLQDNDRAKILPATIRVPDMDQIFTTIRTVHKNIKDNEKKKN